MTGPFVAACLQTNAGPEIDANLDAVAALAEAARKRGADFIMLPEMAALIDAGRERVLAKAEPEDDNRALARFRDLARQVGVPVLVGSMAIKLAPDRLANRSFLIAADGRVTARYDKIHMFDVALDGGETYRESATYQPGAALVLTDLPWGRLGMTVCYDLRFPVLYRRLAQAGADFLSVPSAFTRQTGAAHWHVLLRARAIETGCYVFAPAQCGEHAAGRKTYGHSLIVDPWGRILAEAGEEPGVILARIDPGEVAAARRRIPSLGLERDFGPPSGGPV